MQQQPRPDSDEPQHATSASPSPLFPLGRVFATPGAVKALTLANVYPARLLERHVTGGWDEMGRDDQLANIEALVDGGRIFSAYRVGDLKIWLITEANRASTTILLPSEY